MFAMLMEAKKWTAIGFLDCSLTVKSGKRLKKRIIEWCQTMTYRCASAAFCLATLYPNQMFMMKINQAAECFDENDQ